MAQSLVKDSAIYGLGTLLTRALGLLLIPVYTRYLAVDEYGALSLLNIILQNVSFVCLLGVSTAAMRYYFEPGADEPGRQALYGSATTVLLLFPPLVLLLLAPLTWLLVSNYLPSLPWFPYVLVVLLTGLFTPVQKLMVGLLRVRRRALLFTGFHLAFFVFQTAAIFIAIAMLGLGLAGQVYAQLLANGVFALVAVAMLRVYSKPTLSRPVARHLLAYGVPLVPFFIFMWVSEAAGRFLLERFTDLRQLGIFALAAQFSGLIALAAGAIDNVMLPHFMEQAGTKDAGQRLGALIHRYVTAMGIIGLAILVGASPAIRLLATEPYFPAERHVAPLVLAIWLSVMRTPITWSLNYSKQSATLSALNGAAMTVLIALLLLFLGPLQLGIDGVAYAMIGANLFAIIAGYALAQRHFALSAAPLRVTLTGLTLLAAGGILAIVGPAGLEFSTLAGQSLLMAVASLAAARLAGIANPLRALRPAA
jgi:O-antigen/teichoic acid export membrane protein